MLRRLRRMVVVPSRNSGCIPCLQYMIVYNVQRKAAIDGDLAAFMFVSREVRWKVRNHVPNICDAIANVDMGIVEADEIAMSYARFSPGVDHGRKIGRNVV